MSEVVYQPKASESIAGRVPEANTCSCGDTAWEPLGADHVGCLGCGPLFYTRPFTTEDVDPTEWSGRFAPMPTTSSSSCAPGSGNDFDLSGRADLGDLVPYERTSNHDRQRTLRFQSDKDLGDRRRQVRRTANCPRSERGPALVGTSTTPQDSRARKSNRVCCSSSLTSRLRRCSGSIVAKVFVRLKT